jgi:hypothetical protein
MLRATVALLVTASIEQTIAATFPPKLFDSNWWILPALSLYFRLIRPFSNVYDFLRTINLKPNQTV